MVTYPPDGSARIAIHFEDAYSGAISTHAYRADALYGMTREGFLPENIRTVFWIDFPSPANSRWYPTDNHVDYRREELCAMIASMVKPFTPYWDKS